MILLAAAYVAASLGLFIYSANCYVLVALFLRRRWPAARESSAVIAKAWRRFESPETLPKVTTQIPLFNEANVAERALRAAAAIDYPADLHEVQVLDDSTDETKQIVDRVAAELVREGHRVKIIRRAVRTGYKAGALAEGLAVAAGEYVAIFDADFFPPRTFLRCTLPFFFKDERLALVQARWGHLNDRESALTRAQAIGIDGHFMVEQSARTFNGLLMNFNGTAGLWRRRAIEDAGGWSADTLTEDLDLSYRAQLQGWRTHFLADLAVPGELPASLAAFKSQQFRWAKGSIQTAVKLLPRIFRSPLSPWVKLQAALHLTHYVIHPLILAVALLALPTALHFSRLLPEPVVIGLVGATVFALVAPNVLYFTALRALYPRWWRRLGWLPTLTCVGIGLALSNSWAVWEGLRGTRSEFIRTPKKGDLAQKNYRVGNGVQPWIEIGIGLYCAASLFFYLAAGKYAVGPFFVLYSAGFLAFGVAGLREARILNRPEPDGRLRARPDGAPAEARAW